MNTGLEDSESPLTANASELLSESDQLANGSERWDECKIIKYSETEYRIVCYNKSKRRKNTGNKKQTTAASNSSSGQHEPTEREKDRKVRKNKEELYGYLTANQWEYKVCFYDVKKPTAATLSDAIRQYCKNKGHKLKYVYIPVDSGETFYFVGAVSGVPVDVLQGMDFCKCRFTPFISEGSQDAKELREILQYRQGKRGFLPSQNLNEPTETIIKNPKCYQGDITTDLYAVSTFESLDKAMQFIETGERMGKEIETFEVFEDKIKSLMKKEQWFKCIPLNLVYKKYGMNIDEAMNNISRESWAAPEREIEVAGRTQKTKYEIFTAFDKESGYILRQLINNEDFYYDTFPVLYIIQRKSDKMIFYAGVSFEPLNRYCDHFGINDFNKNSNWLGEDWGSYWNEKEEKNTSEFYRLVKEKGWDFNDFEITFVLLDKWFDGENWREYVPMLRKSHKPDEDKSKYIREAERAEAMLQTYFLEMDSMGFKVYKKDDGTTLLENGQLNYEKTMTIREEYMKKYKEMYLDKEENPLYTAIKRGGYSLREMFELLFNREMKYWMEMSIIYSDTKKVKKAVEFAEKVWKRKAEMLGFPYNE